MHEDIYAINQNSDTKDIINFQICGTTYPDKNYRIERKNSKIACIEYIESGKGTVHIGSNTFYPTAKDSYFLQTGKNQLYYSDKRTPWKKHFINISGKLLESLAEGYNLTDCSYFKGLDLASELAEIIELSKNQEADNTHLLIELINKIFLKMYYHSQNNSEKTLELRIMDYLNTLLTSSFSLDLVCERFSISESQMIKRFKRTFGVTPYSYVLSRKIQLARKLLDNTNLSIKEIAEKLCFSDEYYFSNLFKSKVGLSPSSYRKRELGNQSE